jgi:PKHD-type hydroxylase
MHSILENVLSVERLAQIRALLTTDTFVDGRATSVLASKNNLQLPLGSEVARAAGAIVLDALHEHPRFRSSVLPSLIHPPLFSRYDLGMQYPVHVDVALMGRVRTDVALTLFLSDWDSYEGGDLVVDTGNGERRYRLAAGDAIAYPASTFHYVAPVTRGTRIAAVSWVQSSVRDADKRRLLADLQESATALESTICGPRLLKSYCNLLRLWADPGQGF